MPIEMRNVTHVYSGNGAVPSTAIHNINMQVDEGEFVILLGHTGSGKSTLIQHMNGLLKPTEGQILVDGVDMNGEKTDKRAIRQKVGLVFQYPEYQLFEETVAKDIAFGPKNLGLDDKEIDSRVREAMDFVKLDYGEIAEKSPFELSGGQMRRVAIAGVLAMKPKYLILDEPAAGLDPEGRDSILSIVQELHNSQGVTVIMVSHSMDDAASLATRLVVLDHGSIAMTGTPREIFARCDEMRKIGLDIPEAAQLAIRLRNDGFDIPKDIYTEEEIRDAILALWKGKK